MSLKGNFAATKQNQQKFQLIKGIAVRKSRLDKIPTDEFNNLAVEDDINEERQQTNSGGSGGPRLMIPHNFEQMMNKNQDFIDFEASLVSKKQWTGRVQGSPSISNKIPNSLAFRMKNQEEEENSASPNRKERAFAGTSNRNADAQNQFEEDFFQLSSRRLGTVGDIYSYSLRDKDELNRNIPFTKLKNMDFSGIAQLKSISPTKLAKFQTWRCPQLINNQDSLKHLVEFLDFENLLKLMSLNKQFREGFISRPTPYHLEILKIFKRQLRRLLILGLSSTLQRIQYWNFKTKFFYGQKKKPNLYNSLKSLKTQENAAADIRKDVHRTFPDLSYFKSHHGQQELFNVLNALAQKNVKTGYIQGMNFLAGTILINLQKGEETFWMMMSILNKYGFDGILDLRSGGKFQLLCFQLEMLMQSYLPELADHLKKLGIPTDIYAANWFITMFCYELSLDLVFCILDVFLLEGIKSLLRVSLALLNCMQEQLLKMSYDDCMVYLSHCQKELEIDSQTLLEAAYSYKITYSLLNDLEQFYSLRTRSLSDLTDEEDVKQTLILRAFNRMSLESEKSEKGKVKQYWILLPATPEDMSETVKLSKNSKRKVILQEEEILMFYQNHLKHKRLSDIVVALSKPLYEEKSIELPKGVQKNHLRIAPQISSAVQPSKKRKNQDLMLPKYIVSGKTQKQSRRKALSTAFNDLDTARELQKKNIKQLDSMNTIYELSNDEYSRGGYSSKNKHDDQQLSPYVNSSSKQQTRKPFLDSKVIAGQRSRGVELDESGRSPSQKTAEIDYRSIQMHKSVINIATNMASKDQQIISQTPKQKDLKIVDKTTIAKSTESPFQQLGSRIKTIFGNFFKVEEKMNKSYEDIVNNENNSLESYREAVNQIDGHQDTNRNTRSKSIYNSILPNPQSRESPEILIVDHVYNPIAYQTQQSNNLNQHYAKENPVKHQNQPLKTRLANPDYSYNYHALASHSKSVSQFNKPVEETPSSHSQIKINESIKNSLMNRKLQNINHQKDNKTPQKNKASELRNQNSQSPDLPKRQLFPNQFQNSHHPQQFMQVLNSSPSNEGDRNQEECEIDRLSSYSEEEEHERYRVQDDDELIPNDQQQQYHRFVYK